MADKMNYGDCTFYPIPAVNRLIKEGNKDIAERVTTLESSVSTMEADLDLNNASAFMPNSELNAVTPTAGENYNPFGGTWYFKRGSRVYVHIGVNNLTPNAGNIIFTLPEGYRPGYQYGCIGQGQTATSISGVVVATSGTVTVYGTTAYCCCDFDFETIHS